MSMDNDAWKTFQSLLESEVNWNSRYAKLIPSLYDRLRQADSVIKRERGRKIVDIIPSEAMTALLVDGYDFVLSETNWTLNRFIDEIEWIVSTYAMGQVDQGMAIGEWVRRGDGLTKMPRLALPPRVKWFDNHHQSALFFQQHYFEQRDGVIKFVAPKPTVSISAEPFDIIPTEAATLMGNTARLLQLLQSIATHLTVTTGRITRLADCPLTRSEQAIGMLSTQFTPHRELQHEIAMIVEGVIAFAHCIKQ